jgi:hypothetical protein
MLVPLHTVSMTLDRLLPPHWPLVELRSDSTMPEPWQDSKLETSMLLLSKLLKTPILKLELLRFLVLQKPNQQDSRRNSATSSTKLSLRCKRQSLLRLEFQKPKNTLTRSDPPKPPHSLEPTLELSSLLLVPKPDSAFLASRPQCTTSIIKLINKVKQFILLI